MSSSTAPIFFELLSSGLLQEQHPSLLGIYTRVIVGEDGFPVYRQVGGDGCVDVVQGFWRIYKFGGHSNVMWNFCEAGSEVLRPPVSRWRMGRGFFSDPLDAATRINTTGEVVEEVVKDEGNTSAEDAVDQMNNSMIGRIIAKIDEFNGELDELAESDDLKCLEEKLSRDLNELEIMHNGNIERVIKEEQQEINELKSKYSKVRLKIIEEMKTKQENVRDNYREQKKALEENRDARKAAVEKAIEKLTKNLYNLQNSQGSEPNPKVRKDMECPVCLQEMKPPAHIFECSSGHLVCDLCRGRLEKGTFFETGKCPTCRVQNIKGRNLAMERLARTLYDRQ